MMDKQLKEGMIRKCAEIFGVRAADPLGEKLER